MCLVHSLVLLSIALDTCKMQQILIHQALQPPLGEWDNFFPACTLQSQGRVSQGHVQHQWQRQGDSTGHIAPSATIESSNIWDGREKMLSSIQPLHFSPRSQRGCGQVHICQCFKAGRAYYWCLSLHLNICTLLSFGQHLASPWFVPASFCVHLPCSGDRLSEIMRVLTHF